MSKIKVNETEYQLKYTIESWKKLKEKHDITPNNLEAKISENFAEVISSIVYFGLKPSDRANIQIEDLEKQLGFDVIDLVYPAIMESMPKTAKSSEGDDGQSKK